MAEQALTERWRLCARHPHYQVSDQGRVRRTTTGRILKASQNHKQGRPGYAKVCLGAKVQVYVHQLVAEAFLGPIPAGHNVDHISHDRNDNSATNLRYLPKPDNDFRWLGRSPKGHNLWASPYLDGEPTPDDHQPMTESEHEQYLAEHAAAGW